MNENVELAMLFGPRQQNSSQREYVALGTISARQSLFNLPRLASLQFIGFLAPHSCGPPCKQSPIICQVKLQSFQ